MSDKAHFIAMGLFWSVSFFAAALWAATYGVGKVGPSAYWPAGVFAFLGTQGIFIAACWNDEPTEPPNP